MSEMKKEHLPLTGELIDICLPPRFEDYPATAIEVAKQCLIDWMAVTIAGAREPLVQLLVEELAGQSDAGSCAVPGRLERLGLIDASLVVGSAAHALDYDDGNSAGGHITAPTASAVMPLAQHLKANGKDVIAAFIAGYEFASRCALAVMPDHYSRGFHSTATVGTLGAAFGSAHLLGLNRGQTMLALGIAATQAAGLLASFGTMCKPLHVGRAASNGLLASRLAARGFIGRDGILEHERGFAAAHGADFFSDRALRIPDSGFHVLNNIFKFHAACALTHASMEALKKLRGLGVTAEEVKKVLLCVNPFLDKACNIAEPKTGLEAKFSLKMTAAMVLGGVDTADPGVFSDATISDAELIRLRDIVDIQFEESRKLQKPEIIVTLKNGSIMTVEFESGIPERNLRIQAEKVSSKFLSLVTPRLGEVRSVRLLADLCALESIDNVGHLMTAA